MALSKKRKQNIKNDAAEQAKDMASTVEDTEAFIKDYEEVLTALNEKIENRLGDFEAEAIPILRDLNQSRPSSVLAFTFQEKAKVLELTQNIMGIINPLREAPFRQCVAKCIKDVIDICANSSAEVHKRAKTRAKVKLQ